MSIFCWGHVTVASYIEFVFPERVNKKIVRKMTCRCSVPVIFFFYLLTVGSANESYLLSMGEP